MDLQRAREILDINGVPNTTHRFIQTQYNKIKMKTPHEDRDIFIIRSFLCYIIYLRGDGFISYCDFINRKRIDILWIMKNGKVVLINIKKIDKWLKEKGIKSSIGNHRFIIEYKLYGEKNFRNICSIGYFDTNPIVEIERMVINQ